MHFYGFLKHVTRISFLAVAIVTAPIDAKPAEITRYDVTSKMQEIMEAHVAYKKLNPILAKRALENFIEALDPTKTYFLYDDIAKWLSPKEEDLELLVKEFEQSKFSAFDAIFNKMQEAIIRRDILEKRLSDDILPKNVQSKEFKDLTWCKTETELYDRLKRLRSLQLEVAEKIGEDAKGIALQKINKRRLKTEEEIMTQDPILREQVLCTYIMKALASALDAHTAYYTPSEANQFLISVQQRLLGIGVKLKDDIDGFTVVKVVEGGPADLSKELKAKDKIIAIDKEPVIGLDVGDVVELIRGAKGSKVELRVLREVGDGKDKIQETKDITIARGDVVLQESRLDTQMEPFGDKCIAHLRLHSFYQDTDSSSSADLAKAFEEIKKQRQVLGVVLDLRYNAGGVLAQAVAVTGLFMKKGVVVSIKDENGDLHHLRDLESKMMWDGPLIVLINRGSASAAEIVAQALQDYGRAIIVGDDHTYGKGSFQTFTLASANPSSIDIKGEYKVTRGAYYTASGKSPQLTGVFSDVVIPGGLSFLDVGEKYGKYPLENDSIAPNFNDTFSDLSMMERQMVQGIYLFDQQRIETKYREPLKKLIVNNDIRLKQNKSYEAFLKGLQNDGNELEGIDDLEKFPDFQLVETMSLMKDYILLLDKQLENLRQEMQEHNTPLVLPFDRKAA